MRLSELFKVKREKVYLPKAHVYRDEAQIGEEEIKETAGMLRLWKMIRCHSSFRQQSM
jgi:hypothetical protein